jgi:hypothetical protein
MPKLAKPPQAKPPQVKPPNLLEREVSRQIRDFMMAKGWRAFRQQRIIIPGTFATGEKGMPDFRFVYYLRIKEKVGLVVELWVELKRSKGGVLGPNQVKWIADERDRGACVWIVDDFAEFAELYQKRFAWLHSGAIAGQVEFSF